MRSSSPSTKPRRSAASASGRPAPQGELGAVADAIRSSAGEPAAAPAGELEPVARRGPRGCRSAPGSRRSQGSGSRSVPVAFTCRPIGEVAQPARAPRPRAARRRSGPARSPRRRDGAGPRSRTRAPSPAARSARRRRPASIAARRTAPTASPTAAATSASSASQTARAARPSRGPRRDQAESGGQAEHQRRPGQAGSSRREPPLRAPARRWRRRARRSATGSGPPIRAARRHAALRLRLEPGAEGVHGRRADAADLVELVDRRDAAVLVAEVDDVLGGDRADALDRVELLDRRGAEADRAVARRQPRRRSRR